MAYARLAGLPQEYGLYGAFVPVVAYAALGSSRHLSVGPVVITSLIFGSSLPPIVAKSVPGFRLEGNPNRPLNPEGQAEFNRAAVQVAFLAGLLYTAVGVFRLSFFINFLSASVINGFMTGAAVTIMTSQFRNACVSSLFVFFKQERQRRQRPAALGFFFFFSFFPSSLSSLCIASTLRKGKTDVLTL